MKFGLIPSLLIWHAASYMDHNYRPSVFPFETFPGGHLSIPGFVFWFLGKTYIRTVLNSNKVASYKDAEKCVGRASFFCAI